MSEFPTDEGCERIRDALSAHLDGELAPEENAGVERHLAGCPRCREHREGLHVVRAAVRSLPRHAPGPSLRTRLLASIHSESAAPAKAAAPTVPAERAGRRIEIVRRETGGHHTLFRQDIRSAVDDLPSHTPERDAIPQKPARAALYRRQWTQGSLTVSQTVRVGIP